MNNINLVYYLLFSSLIVSALGQDSYQVTLNEWNQITETCQDMAVYHSTLNPYRDERILSIDINSPSVIRFNWKRMNNVSHYTSDYTDMSFYINDELEKTCFNSTWESEPFTYNLKADDNISWIFKINSDKVPKGFGDKECWLAYSVLSEIPTLTRPRILSNSSTNISIGEPFCIFMCSRSTPGSLISYMLDSNNITINSTGPVQEGTSIPLCARWRVPGTYDVRARAISGSVESEWSSMIRVSVGASAPEVPIINLPSRSFLNEACIVKMGTNMNESNSLVKYIIEWGDGSTIETDFVNPGDDISLQHIWLNPGCYNVRGKAKNNINMSSNWSKDIPIHIYKKSIIHRSDNLQRMINRSNPSDYSAYILAEIPEKYSPLIIESKSNMLLTCDVGRAILDACDTSSYNIQVLDSTNICLENLHLINCNRGIELQNCTNCQIRNNIIDINNCGSGIWIVGGSSNIIELNTLLSMGPSNSSYGNNGIKLDDTNLNIIKENDFRLRPQDFPIFLSNSFHNKLILNNTEDILTIYDNRCQYNVSRCNMKDCRFLECEASDCACNPENPWRCT